MVILRMFPLFIFLSILRFANSATYSYNELSSRIDEIWTRSVYITRRLRCPHQSHYFYCNLQKWSFVEEGMRVGSIVRTGADEILYRALDEVERLIHRIEILINENDDPNKDYTEILRNDEIDIKELYDSYYDGKDWSLFSFTLKEIHSIRFIVGKLSETICYVGYFPIRAVRDEQNFGLYFPHLHKVGEGNWVFIVYKEEEIENQKELASAYANTVTNSVCESEDISLVCSDSPSVEKGSPKIYGEENDEEEDCPKVCEEKELKRKIRIEQMDIFSDPMDMEIIAERHLEFRGTILYLDDLVGRIKKLFGVGEGTSVLVFQLRNGEEEFYNLMEIWNDEMVVRRFDNICVLQIFVRSGNDVLKDNVN